MVDAGSRRSSRRKILLIGVIVVAVILVLAGAIEIGRLVTTSHVATKPTADFGPKLQLINIGTDNPVANNTTLQIQVFSAVPSAFSTQGILHYLIAGSAQTNNGADDELLNATLLPGNTTSSFLLSSTFDTIAAEWAKLLAPYQGKNYPSLTVEATESVWTESKVSIYQYYNNIPYNPANASTVTLSAAQLASPEAAAWFAGTGLNTSAYSQVQLTPVQLNLSVQFPATPVEVYPISGSSGAAVSTAPMRSACLQTDTTCTTEYEYEDGSVTSSTLEKTTYIYGTLPLMGFQTDPGVNGGNSLVDLGASVTVLNDTINLNSAQPYENAQGQVTTAMSTSPSYSHTANVTVGTSGNSYAAVPLQISENNKNNFSVSQNRTSASVGIQGVEYEFQNFKQYTYEYQYEYKITLCCQGTTCHSSITLVGQTLLSTTYDGVYTSGGIININSTAGLQIAAGYDSIWVAWTMDHFVDLASNGTLSLTTSGADDTYQASSVWAETYGYTTANNALKAAQSTLADFATALSFALDIAAVAAALNAIDFDSSESVVVAAVASIIADSIGLAATLIGQFASISTYTGTEAVTFSYWFTNQPFVGSGSPYTVAYYEGSHPCSFTLSGTTYSFYAPENWMNATAVS